MKKKLLIFIPAYNAGNFILKVLNDIPLSKLSNFNTEILVINDCSTDKSDFFLSLVERKLNTDILKINTPKTIKTYNCHH